MGLTIDVLRGRLTVYLTCDGCGLPILDTAHVDPPSGARDYERYSHPHGCPDDDAADALADVSGGTTPSQPKC